MRKRNDLGDLGLLKTACIVLVFCAEAVISSPAQTFKTVVSFDGNNGAVVDYGSLTQGANGNVWGMTAAGGTNLGTVFQVSPQGKLISYSLPVVQQGPMWDSLVQATDGNFYGTTTFGGYLNYGTVFKITPTGTVTTLYEFCELQPTCADGYDPLAGLVQGIDGNFYGTTYQGGANSYGTVFKITSKGAFTTLHSFTDSDGSHPFGLLLQASDGNFYGTTAFGGANCGGNLDCGTVFKITAKGTLTTMWSFCSETNCSDGSDPNSGMIQATDGDFYGVTGAGGNNLTQCGNVGCGTVFKMTGAGELSTLHSFDASDGYSPTGALVQGTDGNFYGTTYQGGANSYGTIFRITPSGTLTTLYNFCSQPTCTDGAFPSGGLVQATDGTFYGTTQWGGTLFDGTVFTLSVGLGPFVKTLPAAGKVGAGVGILGNKLTGTTQVKLNGTQAKFTVKSPTLIVAQVPVGATTGYITVTTPSGTLTSNAPFRVIP